MSIFLSSNKQKKIVSKLKEMKTDGQKFEKLHENDINKKIFTICSVHDIKMSEDERIELSKYIKTYGIYQLNIDLYDFLKIGEVGFNNKILNQYFAPYTEEQTRFSNNYNHFFGKKQIGSLYKIFIEKYPKNVDQWEKSVNMFCGDKISKIKKNIIEKEIKHINRYKEIKDEKQLTKRLKSDINKYIKKFIIINTFFGLSFQFIIVKYLSKKLKINYKFASDEEDSNSIDAFVGNIGFNVKPMSFSHSCGERHYDKKIPIVWYDIDKKQKKITIEYSQLFKELKNDEN